MQRSMTFALVLLIWAAAVAPAAAQRFTFERSIDVTAGAALDISTQRGKIEISAGAPGRIVVNGTVTVRVGWDAPANAVDLAKKVASQPPIESTDRLVRLRPPSDPTEQRAITVSYIVRVPPDTPVQAMSDSGATSISDVTAAIALRTQSAAISLNRTGPATITTGSGDVDVTGIAGALKVTTDSSAVTIKEARGGVQVRTGSGAVRASLGGKGDVDVHTNSSGIEVHGVDGTLTASSDSGRVTLSGEPGGEWQVTTGSGAVDVTLPGAARVTLDASTSSGSVRTEGAKVNGSSSDRAVSGTIAGGGPTLKIRSRSGSVRVRAGG